MGTPVTPPTPPPPQKKRKRDNKNIMEIHCSFQNGVQHIKQSPLVICNVRLDDIAYIERFIFPLWGSFIFREFMFTDFSDVCAYIWNDFISNDTVMFEKKI